MRIIILSCLTLLINTLVIGQIKTPKDFGFRHLQTIYRKDTVDILIQSKKGEEEKQKPLFFFCQGSMPQPLIKTDGDFTYGLFPFNPDSILTQYHIAIVSKPNIPLIADEKELDQNHCLKDTSFFRGYVLRNYLEYYVNRNINVISFLQKQKWLSTTSLVAAGHSEGSTIAAEMAFRCKKITHLIYSGGNPYGRIMSILEQSRSQEKDTDSTRYGEEEIKYWKAIVNDKDNLDYSQGDTYKGTYQFSFPMNEHIRKLKIPVLVCYSTKDWSSPYNDLMQIDFIRNKINNVTFKAYVGLEHNYFPLLEDNKPNYEIFNWDKVANDWLKWLKNTK